MSRPADTQPVTDVVGVSVMFTDLVDSTELAGRAGAAKAERLRVEHFALLRDAIEAHRGRVVKNLGDGIMSTFTSAGAALDAAVEIQQSARCFNERRADSSLSIRIGVAAGDCVEENGDYFGEPVVKASRLCALAGRSQILATAEVQVLTPRSQHHFAPNGELELKGLPEPVPSVEVMWEVASPIHSSIPMPDRLAVTYELPFVGRAHERDTLATALKRTSEGERRVALVSGEAGIGKTRMCIELAAHAHDTGMLVLYGACDQDSTMPYGPWVELLCHYFDHATPTDLRHLGDARVAQLAPLLRLARGGVEPTLADDTTEPYALFAAVKSVIASLATQNPVLAVIDDLHWADRGALQLLRHVVSSLPAAALLVVGTYRDTQSEIGPDLTETLAALVERSGSTV